jgi:hypothetical protein
LVGTILVRASDLTLLYIFFIQPLKYGDYKKLLQMTALPTRHDLF